MTSDDLKILEQSLGREPTLDEIHQMGLLLIVFGYYFVTRAGPVKKDGALCIAESADYWRYCPLPPKCDEAEFRKGIAVPITLAAVFNIFREGREVAVNAHLQARWNELCEVNPWMPKEAKIPEPCYEWTAIRLKSLS